MQCCSLQCHHVAKRTAAYAQKHVAAIEDRRIAEADLTETEAYEAGESERIAFGGDDSEDEERRVTQARLAKAVPHAAPRVFSPVSRSHAIGHFRHKPRTQHRIRMTLRDNTVP
jgi:hypothetical protein